MRGSAGCGLGQRSDRVDGNHDVDSRREDLDDSGISSGELIGSFDDFSFGAWPTVKSMRS
tara:strand:- start:3369 stop:3548 length:180 start_codon:yes stop_codon:yes gene_type:complete